MEKCKTVKIETPERYLLNGLWYGGDNAKRGLIFIHGLSSSAFALNDVLKPLVDENTAALFFNNRGNNIVAKIHKLDDSEKGYSSELIGVAHEKFTDCVDDIQGAINLMKDSGIEDIYLVGHSTGCQKSIYFLSDEERSKQVRGTVLLCALSDYAAALVESDEATLKKAVEHARELVEAGKPDEIIDQNIWPEYLDAQRFLSLYTPDSVEEIFSYATDREPETLKSVSTPMLVVFAEKDEYADRPAQEIIDWFNANNNSNKFDSFIVKNAIHNLLGEEAQAAEKIEHWLDDSPR